MSSLDAKKTLSISPSLKMVEEGTFDKICDEFLYQKSLTFGESISDLGRRKSFSKMIKGKSHSESNTPRGTSTVKAEQSAQKSSRKPRKSLATPVSVKAPTKAKPAMLATPASVKSNPAKTPKSAQAVSNEVEVPEAPVEDPNDAKIMEIVQKAQQKLMELPDFHESALEEDSLKSTPIRNGPSADAEESEDELVRPISVRVFVKSTPSRKQTKGKKGAKLTVGQTKLLENHLKSTVIQTTEDDALAERSNGLASKFDKIITHKELAVVTPQPPKNSKARQNADNTPSGIVGPTRNAAYNTQLLNDKAKAPKNQTVSNA